MVKDNFDIVLIEHVCMAQYHRLFPANLVLQEHNIESQTLWRFVALSRQSGEKLYETGTLATQVFHDAEREYQLLRAYENRIWPVFSLRVTVSKNDKREMNSRCSSGRTIVVENGINSKAISMIPVSGTKKILFMGTMDYYPNVDAVYYFVNQVLPQIWKNDADVTLCIAGRNPSSEMQRLASHPQIEVIGYPKDMNVVAQTCGLTVVPIRVGGGTRIKILHALAMGLPVVSTSLGCEGLTAVHGEHILIEDEPSAFADAALRLLADRSLGDYLRINGRKLVEERYDWRIMFKRLEAELSALAAQRS
jgi:glycosyltransferase involved in cell wall biosynthesis